MVRLLTSITSLLVITFSTHAVAQRLSEPAGSGQSPDIVINEETTPSEPTTVACVEGIGKRVIDFEEFDEGAKGTALSEALWNTYGVRLVGLYSGDPQVIRLTERGDARVKKGLIGWYSSACPGGPNQNRLCNGGDGGKRALALSRTLDADRIDVNVDGKQKKRAVVSLGIELKTAVSEVTFDLADIDGTEAFEITAYDADGAELDGVSIKYHGSYSLKRSGNSALTPVAVTSAEANIKKVVIFGTKVIKVFGFGIDNIDTGMEPCA